MTLEKAAKDMQELITKHGFTHEGELTWDGQPIFTRHWKKMVEVAWYGERESTMDIKVSMSYGCPKVRIIRNGRPDGNIRDYSSPKRCFNAIAEIVRIAGFEM